MLKLNRKELNDKIYACWIGKNIGGTLGGPYEGKKMVLDCKGFTTEPGVPLPNDDLDLQLIWLKAIREVGPLHLDCNTLGTYWLEYITPCWNEYGVAKSNMKNGLMPPLSGQFANTWKHSNGAWIRTEVWATLYPADTEMAVRYAFEDACVDHGVGDGTHAAIFVAAMESAAFVVNDLRELIKIGLSNIPEDCRFAKYINTVTECYDSGATWLEARNKITDMSLSDPELGWFNAPANVGYAIIGLLYGEGDFKNSMLIAINCGDDTDCSAATVGSILGIMHGTEIIPKDWQEYIGDSIITKCINLPAVAGNRAYYTLPTTCTQFADAIIDTHHLTMRPRFVCITDEETEIDEKFVELFYGDKLDLSKKPEYFTIHNSNLAQIVVAYDTAPTISPLEEKKIKLTFKNNMTSQKNFTCRWIVPDGWSVSGKRTVSLNYTLIESSVDAEFIIKAGENVEAKNRVAVEINCEGQHETIYIPVTLLG